ncbi:cation transporter [Staphylococcus argenteus]|nr:cation transporter [Staphylococcus argenteus]MCG9816844.1 cation transporter [Staphylococcus argenteus]MCG9825270.1 cation transporter [Staphylococcus argenteus]
MTDNEQRTFAIIGMTCASCVQSIEKATRKLEGVIHSNVNLATEKMTVEYNPTAVSVSDITQAVSSAGYEAQEDMETSDEANEERDKKQKKSEIHVDTVFGLSSYHHPVTLYFNGTYDGLTTAKNT